ncbi:MAG: T9SS type A sorting domain-containing protein [Crocinitomicaceae bacterium]|nr:T9SS type A sorting domain-containing protein [Crocinitomicaceae bacterium]
MKKFYLMLAIAGFLMGVSPVQAQITFERTYSDGTEDYGSSVIALSDGYIMCGSTLDDENGDFDAFVTKTNLYGDVVWTNIYSNIGIGDDYATYINAVSDGSFIICGTSNYPVEENGSPNENSFRSSNEDAFILSIDEDGTEQWIETYDAGYSGLDGANYIVEASDGTLLVAGYGSDSEGKHIWVFSTQYDGQFIGGTFLGLSGDDEATKVLETSDGSLAVIGTSFDAINGDYDGILIKLDELGDEEWSYFSAGTADEVFNDVIIDPNGNFLIVGAEEDEVNGDDDLLLENVSFDGNSLYYSYNFDYSGGDDEAYRVYYNGTDYFLAGTVEDTGNNDLDAYLAIIDVDAGDIDGDVLYGDIYDDEFIDFDFTDDGGFICIGYQQVNSFGDSDVYLVKTDENGEVENPAGVDPVESGVSVSVFPNPASGFLSISSTDYRNFQIISTEGKVVKSGTLTSSVISLDGLACGNYNLTLSNNDTTIVKSFIKN